MTDPFAHPPRDLVNLERYPLDDARRRAELAERCRRELAADSCVMLPGFVTEEATRRMVDEAMATLPRANRRDHHLTPYGPPRTDLPAGDPRTITSRNTMHAVAGDDIADSTGVQRLYRWDGLTRFIAEVVKADELHRVLDPIFNCNLSIIGEGESHHWHFDSNDFVVTLLLQRAEAGGDFEFAPYIRSETDENYSGVAEVLRGGKRGVKTVRVEPGTLVLFCGKYSLHRVSPVDGKQKRIIALYSYDKRPDKMFSDENALRVFNRRRVTRAAAD
ncbi:MAG: 2OG-Fe(II) oxygenase [Alphaproteobacteria bacterium]|nr:2OG-Fe(II) oxygenase [Alphaproteobacteria bacterium]